MEANFMNIKLIASLWLHLRFLNNQGLLTHWSRAMHICVNNLTIIDSDNSLSPGRFHAIIWTRAGLLLIGPIGTNFSEISIEHYTLSFKQTHLEMSSGKWLPFCLGLNVFIQQFLFHRNSSFITASNSVAIRCSVPWIMKRNKALAATSVLLCYIYI